MTVERESSQFVPRAPGRGPDSIRTRLGRGRRRSRPLGLGHGLVISCLACLALAGVGLSMLAAPSVSHAQAGNTELVIGVLAHRGAEKVRTTWQATAEYLQATIPEYRFSIRPVDFDGVLPAIERGELHFIIVNPAIYAALAERGRLERVIATLRGAQGGVALTSYGGVIFARERRQDIGSLADLKGQRFGAVHPDSLGGFLAAWDEMAKANVAPYDDLTLEFLGNHDAVVRAVIAGELDAGTVRTGTLERLAAAGEIELTEVKILNRKHYAGFTPLFSTELYPEWPLAQVKPLSLNLVNRIAVALLEMAPDAQAAEVGGYAGWNTSASYRPVRDLLAELEVETFRQVRELSFFDILSYYSYYFIVAGAIAVVLLLVAWWHISLNRRLKAAHLHLIDYESDLKRQVDAQGRALKRSEEALHQTHARIARVQQNWSEAFDVIKNMIFVHDDQYRIVRANRAYLSRLNVSLDDVVGQPYWEFFPKGDGPVTSCARMLEDGAFQRGNQEIHTESGEVFVDLSFVFRDEHTGRCYAIHILEDLSDERRADEREVARTLEQVYRDDALVEALDQSRFKLRAQFEHLPSRSEVVALALREFLDSLDKRPDSDRSPAAANGDG